MESASAPNAGVFSDGSCVVGSTDTAQTIGCIDGPARGVAGAGEAAVAGVACREATSTVGDISRASPPQPVSKHVLRSRATNRSTDCPSLLSVGPLNRRFVQSCLGMCLQVLMIVRSH